MIPRLNRIDIGWLVVAGLGSGCGAGDGIPPVDGPLVLEVRYPAGEPIAATDSVATWGTIGTGKGTLVVDGRAVSVAPNGGFATFVPVPRGRDRRLQFEARKGSSVLRRSVPIPPVKSLGADPATPKPAARWVTLRRPPSDTVDAATQARPIFSRWTPGGPLAVPLTQGLRLPVDAETPAAVRLRLARHFAVWVPTAEASAAPSRQALTVTRVRVTQSPAQSAVLVPLAEPVPSMVEVVGTEVRWTLFTVGAAAVGSVAERRGLVRRVTTRDAGDGRVVVTVSLDSRPLGWRAGWREGVARLEIRPPRRGSGLTGLVVGLDAGHPPGGSTGPTGLTEDSLTLAVARETARQLEAAGARPVLIRTDSAPVSLDERIVRAERGRVDLFVSIHVNAPGDGRPPWSVDGTRVFWVSPHSLPLAKQLEDSVAASLGQVHGGAIQQDFAVLRPTWYPSVLVEATALVLPVREAMLRAPAGVTGYARGLVGGIRAWVADSNSIGGTR